MTTSVETKASLIASVALMHRAELDRKVRDRTSRQTNLSAVQDWLHSLSKAVALAEDGLVNQALGQLLKSGIEGEELAQVKGLGIDPSLPVSPGIPKEEVVNEILVDTENRMTGARPRNDPQRVSIFQLFDSKGNVQRRTTSPSEALDALRDSPPDWSLEEKTPEQRTVVIRQTDSQQMARLEGLSVDEHFNRPYQQDPAKRVEHFIGEATRMATDDNHYSYKLAVDMNDARPYYTLVRSHKSQQIDNSTGQPIPVWKDRDEAVYSTPDAHKAVEFAYLEMERISKGQPLIQASLQDLSVPEIIAELEREFNAPPPPDHSKKSPGMDLAADINRRYEAHQKKPKIDRSAAWFMGP